jgi:hypothetical protein
LRSSSRAPRRSDQRQGRRRAEQLACLARAQAGEDQCRDQRAATDGPLSAGGVALEVDRGVEQHGDVLGGVQVHRARPRHSKLAAPDLDRVARDQVVLHGDVEDLTQPDQMLVDRLGAQAALADLVLAVAVDLLHRDLRDTVLCKERQQVARELVLVGRGGAWPNLTPFGGEPVRRELVERRVLNAGRRGCQGGRLPDTAPDIGEHVL